MAGSGNSTLVIPIWSWRHVLHSAGKLIIWFCPILIMVTFWEFAARAHLINESVFPTFTAVSVAGYDLFQGGQIFLHLITSFYRAISGLAIGSIVGIALGMLMAYSRIVRDIVDPFVTLTFSLPKAAFIPIAFLWLGVGNASIILVVFLSTLVPMIISAYDGARSVNKQLIWSAQTMGASHLRMLTSIVFPASLPYIFNGVRIGLAFSVVVVISAEMVAAYIGIGKFILLFGEGGNYNYMFAIVFVVIVVSFLLDQCFLLLSRRGLRWLDDNDV
ncbi:MAG: ABC transporter permease [Ardenticatenaceae bacterium]|nr:ABC transporter permease [Ardenticatenaceae bacterium]